MKILRTQTLLELDQRLQNYPIVAILGPRQCGKTTLAKQFISNHQDKNFFFFDCEDMRDLAKLDQPMFFLERAKGIVIIAEIQRKPDLFPTLRVIADQKKDRKSIILGSASRDLVSHSSETLAGRISFIELSGFVLNEISPHDYSKLWLRGGFPRSFLAESDESSAQWREDFIRTFFERDIPNLGLQVPSALLRRFWIMLSHYHGQIFNASEMGRSFGVSDTTITRYLDLLTNTLLIRQIQPWYYNTKKRLIKRPKIYLRDSGLLHSLLTLTTFDDLFHHPRLGASWEGFACEQAINSLQLKEEETFFWGTHTGAELDLLFRKRGKIWGMEFKFTDSPKMTRSMSAALQELELQHLWLIYAGNDTFPLSEKITATGLNSLKSGFEFELVR